MDDLGGQDWCYLLLLYECIESWGSKEVALWRLSAKGQVSSKSSLLSFSFTFHSPLTFCRLLQEWMTQQHCSAPRISHPLTLSQSLPQALFLGVTLSVALATRTGRIAMLSLLGFFTAVTFISPLFSKKWPNPLHFSLLERYFCGKGSSPAQKPLKCKKKMAF